MTLGQIIIVVIVGLFLMFSGFCVIAYATDSGVGGVVGILLGLILTFGISAGIYWYNHNTASGIRNLKDWHSELENGIKREITITAEDGREIFHYKGKVDIESNHEDNYIKFESEEEQRYIIYYGIQDTVLIIEKPD